MFTICVDVHRFECIIAKRGWKTKTSDISLLLFGLQDASLMAENMVIAAESLGLGSCFLGAAMYMADKFRKKYKLPEHVYPFVHLVMGYPAEEFPPRPRYPLEFTLFEEQYPELTDELIEQSMQAMDEGYLAQDYYRNLKGRIRLEGDLHLRRLFLDRTHLAQAGPVEWRSQRATGAAGEVGVPDHQQAQIDFRHRPTGGNMDRRRSEWTFATVCDLGNSSVIQVFSPTLVTTPELPARFVTYYDHL